MNIKSLAVEMSKREGKKKSLSIAQMSEIVGILCDIQYEIFTQSEDVYAYFLDMMLNHGQKRARKTNKKAAAKKKKK